MTDLASSVSDHYASGDLTKRLLSGLRNAGIDLTRLSRADLGAADQFHHGGGAATAELAKLACAGPGMPVLDIGSGLGGPARTLAADFGCDVTGIDLTREFVDTANTLTGLLGMADRVSFHQGSALQMPFADASFEIAWTQNVMMNIADKAALFREVRRVLKPGGRFAFQDILQGPGGDILLPVPWASEPGQSHLVTEAEQRRLLREAGFTEREWLDTTSRLSDSRLAPPGAAGGAPAAPPAFGLHLVLGRDAGAKGANVLANAREGRIVSVLGVFGRD